jgi:predicted DCC family thiol-disulfide oxidoreductase YuxK
MSADVAPEEGGAIIVFDGVCHLCSAWVQFLLVRDCRAQFRFASLQSPRGRALLSGHGLDPDDPASFLLLDSGVAWTDSEAILRVLARLGGIWRTAAVLHWVPRALRDWLYRWLARHRYRLFGRRTQCWMPRPEDARRFL